MKINNSQKFQILTFYYSVHSTNYIKYTIFEKKVYVNIKTWTN